MQVYFHSRLCSYLPRVPILVEGTVYIFLCLQIVILGVKKQCAINQMIVLGFRYYGTNSIFKQFSLEIIFKMILKPLYLHSIAFSTDLNVFGRLLRKFCMLFNASIAVPEE